MFQRRLDVPGVDYEALSSRLFASCSHCVESSGLTLIEREISATSFDSSVCRDM
jgi:hypothetical protein